MISGYVFEAQYFVEWKSNCIYSVLGYSGDTNKMTWFIESIDSAPVDSSPWIYFDKPFLYGRPDILQQVVEGFR